MRARLLSMVTVASLALATPSVTPSHGAQRPAPECHEWRECSQLALDARARRQYERFHDLAWRAVQTGPRNDPALMYLLARAQSLSNRPRDAIMMLGRLAERGIVTDAEIEEDFEAARRLPGWQDLERLMQRAAATIVAPPMAPLPSPPAVARAPAAPLLPSAPAPAPAADPAVPAGAAGPPVEAPPAAATSVTAPAGASPAAARTSLRFDPRPVEEISRVSVEPFGASSLAYDAVSRRFLLGDGAGRRVVVVREQSDSTVDLVRAASARFHDVTALEIDARRGDLWVASTAPDGAIGAIHRLQLISGRLLAMIEAPRDLQAVKLIDMAIAADGGVLVLDAARPRVIRLRAGTNALETFMPLDITAPASVAVAGDGRTAYVAHQDGVVRLDLQSRRATAVSAPDGIALGGFERIRWHRNALVGVQASPDGSRRVVRLQLDRNHAVADAAVIEASLDRDGGPTFAIVSGDDMYFLVTRHGDAPEAPGAAVMTVVVRRLRLP